MNYFVTAEEMKKCDSHTIHSIGISSLVLMERAAMAVLSELEIKKADLSLPLIVCGMGNNGGDGVVLARLLFCMGKEVTLVITGSLDKATDELKTNLKIAENLGIKWYSDIPQKEYTVIVDAVFGVGLSREIKGTYHAVIQSMNSLNGYHCAIDLPSGVHADTGKIMGTAFQADLTVTFAFAKAGMYLYPGKSCCGDIVVRDVGILEHDLKKDSCGAVSLTKEDLKKWLPYRVPDSNKGSYGKLLLIMGSTNMAGAVCFAAKSAYYAGCGLVRILTSEENRTIVQQMVPEAVLFTYKKSDTKEQLEEIITQGLKGASAVGIGSGISRNPPSGQLLEILLKHANIPLLLDADACNLLSEKEERMDSLHKYIKQKKCPVIFTPHMGELSRLTKKPISKLKDHPILTAKQFAEENQVILVQKDAATIVASPGGRPFLNTTGNAGMATAGSGDVLAGFISGLSAQGMPPEMAAMMGVYIHGMAGDLAAEKKTGISMTAVDLLDAIPEAIRQITQEE